MQRMPNTPGAWILPVALAALLLASPVRAQQAPAPTREEADAVAAFFNDPATIHFSGRTRIPAERTVVGDVAVLGGPLTVAGRVEGSVVVIDGDVELLPGAVITGDLTVVGGRVDGVADGVVGGQMVHFSERLLFRRFGERIEIESRDPAPPPEPAPGGWLARSDFLIASGQSYNRVEGLPITLGPVIETSGSNPMRARALAIYRTESGATLDPERLGYYLRAEQYVGGRSGFRVGGTLHSTVDPIEGFHVLNVENSLSTFLLHHDMRDHYEREGWSAFVAMTLPRRPWELSLVGRSERHRTVASGSPWTLFRNQEPWRAQPLAAEGRVELLSLEGRYDTRSTSADPSHGWYVNSSIERTLRSSLVRPDALEAVPLAGSERQQVPGERFPGWAHGLVDVRRYNRLSPESRLNLRLALGGSLDGAALPSQRQHALGGEGSLPGYALFGLDCGARDQLVFHGREADGPIRVGRDSPPIFVPAYGCDQFALLQAEYRGRLSLRFGWGDGLLGDGDGPVWDLGWAAAPDWVAFVDAGRGWAIGGQSEDLALDLGFGLLFNRVGVYVAAPLRGEGGLNLFVRLGPRF